MPKENIILSMSFDFALEVIKKCKPLQENREYILSKQLIRSGTSVGANIREAQNAVSKKDFIHKLSISQKECDESIYWIELLYQAEYLNNQDYFSLKKEAESLLKILKSIIITTRQNMKTAIHH
ncbi:MAG: four helix bundle protein [Crocinitomicaceae bacterium]|nr:four helix bundle protein [Crocinitomicaceae bacterium]